MKLYLRYSKTSSKSCSSHKLKRYVNKKKQQEQKKTL